MDSFPGATIADLKGVVGKTKPNPKVEVIIRSMGIHNRTQDPPETSVADLQKLLKLFNLNSEMPKSGYLLLISQRLFPKSNKIIYT